MNNLNHNVHDLNHASYHTYEKANYLPKTLQNPITWSLVVKNLSTFMQGKNMIIDHRFMFVGCAL
jgi:hypothetical protein